MEEINREAKLCFEKSPHYKRQHSIDPTMPSNKYMKILMILNRNQGAALTQLRTGHVPLAQHLERIKKAESPTCMYCKQAKETVLHYLIKCPTHEHTRANLNLRQKLGRGASNINNLLAHPIAIIHLLQFIDNSQQLNKSFGQVKNNRRTGGKAQTDGKVEMEETVGQPDKNNRNKCDRENQPPNTIHKTT